MNLIGDGDVAGVMHCASAETTGIDMYMGTGGAPEGVLAASALKCMGGQIWGRLIFRSDGERNRAAKAGITDLSRIYSRDEMVAGDVIFSATGVTHGSLLKGITPVNGSIETQTLLLRSKTLEQRTITCRHRIS